MILFTRVGLSVAAVFWLALIAAVLTHTQPNRVLAVGIIALLVLSGISGLVWSVHERRYATVLNGTSVQFTGGNLEAVIHLDHVGMSPLRVNREELLTALLAAEAVSRFGWRIKAQRVLPVSGGHVRLGILTNGDTTVLNFRGETGPGYRVIVDTENLCVIRAALVFF